MVTLAAPSPPSAFRARHRPLRTRGPPVDLVTISDPETLRVHEQLVADGLIAELEAQARRALRSGYDRAASFARRSLPVAAAVARAARLGARAALAVPPVAGRPARARLSLRGPARAALRRRVSAVDALRTLLGCERAGRIADRHRAFCEAPMTDEARLLMGGAIDARAIRQRALIAAHAVAARGRWAARIAASARHGRRRRADRRGGRARRRSRSSTATRWRWPPPRSSAGALPGRACSGAGAARRGVAELAAAGSFDVIDLTGALDALPDGAAVELLRGARGAAPGGVVVAAAMLDRRPQQTLFDRVLRWPAVTQRSAGRARRLIAAAGFPERQVSLAIPATAPVYAIATIDSAA